jgi:hypothetical protein
MLPLLVVLAAAGMDIQIPLEPQGPLGKAIPEEMELTQPDMQVVVVAGQAALVKMQALRVQVILLERVDLEPHLQLQGHLLVTQVVAGVERVQH